MWGELQYTELELAPVVADRLMAARMGKFSSDRAIKEYRDRIWKAKPITVTLGKYRAE